MAQIDAYEGDRLFYMHGRKRRRRLLRDDRRSSLVKIANVSMKRRAVASS